jgi:hypothetical protein
MGNCMRRLAQARLLLLLLLTATLFPAVVLQSVLDLVCLGIGMMLGKLSYGRPSTAHAVGHVVGMCQAGGLM